MFKTYICTLLIFLLSNNVIAQQFSKKQIDSIQEYATTSLIIKGKQQEALLLNIKTIENGKKIGYDKGVINGYLKCSTLLCTFGEHLESLRYLDLINNDVSEKQTNLKIRIYVSYGRNYAALKINNKAIDYFNKGISLYKKDKSFNNEHFLHLLYINKADAFLNTEYKLDSTLFYIHKAIKVKETPFNNAVLANYYLKHSKNIDSASHYLNRGKFLMKKKRVSAYKKSIIYQAEANLNKSIGNYETALFYYKKSLEISKKTNNYQEMMLAYNLIAETYELLNDKKQAHEYLIKYTTFNDSINKEYKNNVDIVVTKFLSEQERIHKSAEKKLQISLTIGFVISFIIVFLILYYNRKKRLGLAIEKDEEIKEIEIESTNLKKKLNTAFNEVVTLAKTNDPSFLARFQEVYPDVCEKLLQINPKLVNTELSLCAMIWLNFSSKHIAQYTNVQPKTVQTKKYRLRKKLELPEATNLYLWIKNL
jgi:tetratricopeptide (TPR) repeat protein